MNILLLAVSLINTALDKAVQPAVVVVLTAYRPRVFTLTTSDKPVAPGTTLPLRYHTVVLVALAGVTVAVNVEVWNGNRLVGDVAVRVMVGCTFTVTVTLAQAVVLQIPSALTK